MELGILIDEIVQLECTLYVDHSMRHATLGKLNVNEWNLKNAILCHR